MAVESGDDLLRQHHLGVTRVAAFFYLALGDARAARQAFGRAKRRDVRVSGGRGGLGVFMAPSTGYLVGWPLGALVTGWLMSAFPRSTPRRAAVSAFAASSLGGLLVVHACGVVGLVNIAKLSWTQAFWGTLLFVPGDLLKCAVCALVVHTVARGLPDWNLGGRALK